MQPNDKNARAPEELEELEETQPVQDATDEMQAQLDALKVERDEYLDMAQRLKAEFENFRRRNNAVRSEAYEDGTREMIAAFLPVIDNLERALETQPEQTAFCDGVALVYKQMMETLEKKGVTVIDRVGEPFDPELEHAVVQADASEGEPGTVVTVLQKGYKIKDRVIRHAMVRVVAG